MDDEFEHVHDDDEIWESISPRKFDRHTMVALYLQHKARKKLVKGDLLISISQAILLDRAYREERAKFTESASREIDALVAAVQGEK